MCSQRIDGRSQSSQRGYIFFFICFLAHWAGRRCWMKSVASLKTSTEQWTRLRSFQSPLSAPAGSVTCVCSAGCRQMKYLAQKCETAQKEEGVVHVDMQRGRVCMCVCVCVCVRVCLVVCMASACTHSPKRRCYLCSSGVNPRINNWNHSFMIASQWPRSVTRHHVSVGTHAHTHTRVCKGLARGHALNHAI